MALFNSYGRANTWRISTSDVPLSLDLVAQQVSECAERNVGLVEIFRFVKVFYFPFLFLLLFVVHMGFVLQTTATHTRTLSQGTAVVTEAHAALWTDGRYFLQAEKELDRNWTLQRSGVAGVPSQDQWLKQVGRSEDVQMRCNMIAYLGPLW